MYSDLIKQLFEESNQTYGSPRITAALRRRGHIISERRVRGLVRLNGRRSRMKKRFSITTNSNYSHSICRNHLNGNFTANHLNEVWVSDITYIKTAKGWLYLTTIIDLYDRQVIGWSLSNNLFTEQTIIPAWKMAISKRQLIEPLLFHSDRGIQYASKEFRKIIEPNTFITQSMSRKANCWDNAVAESFFETLKVELVYHQKFNNLEEAKSKVFEYIEVWYNRKRLHSSLGYKTPCEV